MQEALYSPSGFYHSLEGPAGHFRTSVHSTSIFAEAVRRLASSVGLQTIMDVGAGRGELLKQLYAIDPGLRLIGLEVAERPKDLPDSVGWVDAPPAGLVALVIANEWLDNIPLDVVIMAAGGPRLVLVDPATGREELGPVPDKRDLDWLTRWWPLDNAQVGDRAEIGATRDVAWAALVGGLAGGVAVAIDYGHLQGRRPRHGTLTGYLAGRQVEPIPDGSRDITAHVAMDSCAAAATRVGAATAELTTQRDALHELGVTGARPPLDLARSDPPGYARALARATQAADLTARSGLGSFLWLRHDLR
jgi:SAM-dependent MidA family methyltransferase